MSNLGIQWHQHKLLLSLICVILIKSLVSTLVFTNLQLLETLILQVFLSKDFHVLILAIWFLTMESVSLN